MAKKAPTFYVFHGNDEFTRAETVAEFKRKLGPPDTVELNTTYLEGKKLSLAELRHACDAIPFLADKRLVIVDGMLSWLQGQKAASGDVDALLDYLPRLPDTTRLVFVEDKSLPAKHPVLKLAQKADQGYVKQFEPPKNKALPGWIVKRAKKHGSEIEPRAAHQLAAVVGDDLRLLDQEILKLAIYTNGERPITTDDVDALTPYVQEAIVFDMVDALGRRDGPTAAQTLHRLLETGEHPMGLLAMIVRQFRLLIQVHELKRRGENANSIARIIKLHPFPTKKLYSQANYFTAAQLEKVYRHLLETDVAIKTGQIDVEVALDLLVAGIAGAP